MIYSLRPSAGSKMIGGIEGTWIGEMPKGKGCLRGVRCLKARHTLVYVTLKKRKLTLHHCYLSQLSLR